jgi:hypothetical protein
MSALFWIAVIRGGCGDKPAEGEREPISGVVGDLRFGFRLTVHFTIQERGFDHHGGAACASESRAISLASRYESRLHRMHERCPTRTTPTCCG